MVVFATTLRIKVLVLFTQNLSLSYQRFKTMGLGSGIRKNLFRIQGQKGTGSATLI